ncbi:bifunctional nuclease family protein [Petrotoga sp. 9PWA.NaAc.5.4]|uniref:bifunctional nuclease family protein n=1 Tax=Petrotoga sp. 9PWA.NaAc.5.4 TaxID=1434328 RepID=UPI000CBC6E26|nr:bifunctional nuclease family protein [Petrotoga sp. 9PWA.NaAc.5.4]PNR92450.1 hypothetical protein X924_09330 [Petrotoga sp. 9PWA.NaAc.5.4]
MRKISNITMGIDKLSNSPIVFLKVENTNLVVPIWIGPCEAGVLALILRNEEFERPLTHDLIQSVIENLGAIPIKVLIDEFKNDIYFAKLILEDKDSNQISIDARPSDCIILSLKKNIPIFIDEKIAVEHSIDSSFFEENEENSIKKDIDNFNIDELRRKFEKKDDETDEDNN